MATWTSSVQNSSFNAGKYMSDASNARKFSINSGYNGLDGGKVSFLGIRLAGYDVIGINASKIKNSVIPAFDTYISGIQGKIDDINVTAAAMDNAFKGTELQKQVKAYVEKMEKFMLDYTSQLKAFEDKLMDVKNAWEKSQQVQAQGVSKTASSFASVKNYTRQINQ